ncbi:DDE-type integrase/transposase/recombinase, partial [Dolosicoccus paucivorans]
MRYRQKVVEYAEKYNNNAKAARRYGTSRQNVQRWRKRYDKTWDSLRNKSRRPHSHPNQHTQEELQLIQKKYRRFKHEGLAEVYVQCRKEGYSRTYASMCKQIRDQGWNKDKEEPQRSNPKSRWKPDPVHFPGEKVQIDIKYVPQFCLLFDTKGKRYYQITALDEFSRMRVCTLVDEKSVTNTALFLLDLEEAFGFPVHCVQTDNGTEFTNAPDEGARQS